MELSNTEMELIKHIREQESKYNCKDYISESILSILEIDVHPEKLSSLQKHSVVVYG